MGHLFSLENGSLEIQTMDEETINTNTTYYQYSWKDYTHFGKEIIKPCKSGYGNPHIINQSIARTFTLANTVYNAHSARMIVERPAQMHKRCIDEFGRASTTFGMKGISPIPKIAPKFFLGIAEKDGRYLQRPPIHIGNQLRKIFPSSFK
jgi:hypothetical protein